MYPMAAGGKYHLECSRAAIDRLQLIVPSRIQFDCWSRAELLPSANPSNPQVTEESPLRLHQRNYYDYCSAEMHRLAPVKEFFTR